MHLTLEDLLSGLAEKVVMLKPCYVQTVQVYSFQGGVSIATASPRALGTNLDLVLSARQLLRLLSDADDVDMVRLRTVSSCRLEVWAIDPKWACGSSQDGVPPALFRLIKWIQTSQGQLV